MIESEWQEVIEHATKMFPKMKPRPAFMGLMFDRNARHWTLQAAKIAINDYALGHPDDQGGGYGSKLWESVLLKCKRDDRSVSGMYDKYGNPPSIRSTVIQESRERSANAFREIGVRDPMRLLSDDDIYEGWMKKEWPGIHAKVNGYKYERPLPPGWTQERRDRETKVMVKKFKEGKMISPKIFKL